MDVYVSDVSGLPPGTIITFDGLSNKKYVRVTTGWRCISGVSDTIWPSAAFHGRWLVLYTPTPKPPKAFNVGDLIDPKDLNNLPNLTIIVSAKNPNVIYQRYNGKTRSLSLDQSYESDSFNETWRGEIVWISSKEKQNV